MTFTKNTDEYDKITSNNYCNTSSLSNCTDSEVETDIIIPSLLLILPCTLSILCLLSLIVYVIIKALINNKKWKKIIPKTSS